MRSFNEKPSFCHEGTALPLADYDSRFVREGGAPESLNPEQEAAATAVNGRVCINSGAGSGKSTVLIARMVAIQQVFPEARVLLISFTKKSAQELKERIGAMPNVSVSTFHSLCYHLLMCNGYKHFQVSTNDMLQETIIRKLIGKADSTLEEVKVSLINAGAATKETLAVRDKYLNYLLSNRMLTFDTLQVFALELLTKTGIRNRWANQWDFIEIDESQDMDCNQVQLANILATGTGNICYCGDSRQAIYGFRGSLPTVITDFAKSAENYDLTLNYRCNAGILGLGNNIMSKHKPLIAARLDEPVYPKYSACADEADEAKTICDEIALLHKGGMAYSDISILYRSSYASSRIFEELLTRKIPFVAKSFTSFTFCQYPYSSAVAMFRAALMPDSREIIKAILPSLYLKSESMKQVTAIKNKEKCTYLDALTKLQLPFFQREYIASMVQTVARIPSMAPTKAIDALLKAGLGKICRGTEYACSTGF